MERVVDINRWNREHIKTEDDLQAIFRTVQAAFQAQPWSDYAQRMARLDALYGALLEHQDALSEALRHDYGFRTQFDSTICDLLPSIQHLRHTRRHLRHWMKPEKRSAGLLLSPSSLQVHYQPLGVIGVIVPWNFPIFLSLGPVVTAIAAGNHVMVKLSEFTPHTNEVLSRIFSVLEGEIYTIEGGAEIAGFFSRLPFDHLLFTGSTKVGRLVAQAAAQNLTPVTLELGGKSPVIVADDADISKAVDIVMFGKSSNAGQICVAPDYVLLPQGKEQQFIDLYLQRFEHYFPAGDLGREMTQIINQAQYDRLQRYLDDAIEHGGKLHTIDPGSSLQGRQMLPHLVTRVKEKMLLMQEEIFGPILPVIGYAHLSEAISYVNSKPRPLALYLISNDTVLRRQIVQQTHSGGVCINDTLMHVAADDAPFGGIGESGMGHYHGVEGFRTMSKAKTVLSTPSWLPRGRWLLCYAKSAEKLLNRLFVR
ncbi:MULTISPECIES: coniferyl aldehyde dehydrogenase [unclassified Vibrio]|uniref:coniferyl aldehyde dehydrogenase n=1 Tax=unclassified Vibrio TaxID=2614977 RepID=UPI001360FE61|nr:MULTISPECIES: coniferyl aldehyde dehydrogenase [unclassified Vibrio]NAW57953.1 aldehyde dehydrogenase family protein [Vibrio sp. V36_P2S2PM302]NAX25468.1 aldehyde dehydrogenase family protein [Vibrio sp. V38_P2S17PM301]NAX28593.1 aldehyde dehydrogenase family protein [Vibrio sp. V37_P2S8PM304]